jgi:hypothetical protein
VDRCALFVDAGYVLSDGAMAVHGTRHRDSVSWDYAGLLKLLAGLSRDRTGLPVLRCYWYEATVDSRRTSEHEALAELPGLKLRLGKMRPGRREGVETDIHRDLMTLARNRAVSDAVIISAEEDLAQVVAEAQDLGVRVVIVHITVDGTWTISRTLRQESDDIVEISGAHLRPFVDLIPGAEPRADEQYAGSPYQSHSLPNGRSQTVGAVTHQGLPAAALPAPATIYNAPVAAEYQRSGQALAAATGPQAGQRPAQGGQGGVQPSSMQGPDSSGYAQGIPGLGGTSSQVPGGAQARRDDASMMNGQQAYSQEQLRGSMPASSQSGLPQSGLPQSGSSQSGLPQSGLPQNGLPQSGLPQSGPSQSGPSQSSLPQNGLPQSALPKSGLPQNGLPQNGLPQNGLPQNGLPQNGLPQSGPSQSGPSHSGLPYNGLPQNGLPQNGLSQGGLPQNGQAGTAGLRPAGPQSQPGGGGQQYPQGPGGQFTGRDQGSHGGFSGGHQRPRSAAGPVGGFHAPAQSPYIGQQPAAGQPPVNVSLADAVQSAHLEGFGFGEAVARDAPALWLEAVLARKPRMPSDLEARLLQGSALPIDSLLHDEVRHALRRGFWDALERSRR